jgi:uncharacterized RDD family membrane protein YckC
VARQEADIESSSSPDAAGPGPASGAPAPPSLARRFAALVVDWALCLLVGGVIGNPSKDGWPPVVVLIAEYAFFIGLFAQTPGMWLAKIRCVSYGDGGRIGVIRAMLRGVLLCLVIPALVMDGRRRGLHDRAVGSVIVTAPPARS